MAQTTGSTIEQIHALLAARRYSVTETGPGILRVQEVDSGISLQAVLENDILFFSLTCGTVPAAKITAALTRKMLDVGNGIATSHFSLHDVGDGKIAITLDNFCKLQEMGPDDEDDILSCVNFLLADVVHARGLIGGDL